MSDRNVMAKVVCIFLKNTSFNNVHLALIDKLLETFHMTQIFN